MRGLRHSCPKRCLRWLVAVAVAGTSQLGLAQGEDFFDFLPADLSRLRVTAASAFTESALDASASVSVVQRADWERRGARTIPDAAMHLPGVMLLYPPDGGPLIQVRSYDSTSLRGRATLIDGVPINTFAFGSEVFSNAELQLPVLDSLELVRGPSSILYGSDAFHSALLLSTYRSDAPGVEVSGAAGSRDYQRLALRASQTVGNGQRLETAISVAHQGDMGNPFAAAHANGSMTRERRGMSYEAGTAMVRWRGRTPDIGYELQLLVDKTEAEEFPGSGTLTGDVGPNDLADRNGELWLLKGALDGALASGWKWVWDLYGWRNDFGQSYYLPSPVHGFIEDRQQFVEYRYGSRAELKREDLKFGATTTQLALTVGAERAGISDHDNERLLLSGVSLSDPPADYDGLDQTIYSVAIEGKTRWADGRWQLIYGGRFDDYSTFGGELSPRLGLIWFPTDSSSIRAVYGSAFRAPNANELRGINFVSGNRNLDPEAMESFELAFTYLSGNWQWELVGFANRWEDRILLVQDLTDPLGRRYTNIGSSEAQGIESALTYLGPRWRFELNATAMHNENRDTRREPSLFPEWVTNLGIGYRWPQYNLELYWSTHIHQDVTTGDTSLTRVGVTDAGTFIRSDLSLAQTWRNRWQGRFVVRNLFDRDNSWPSITNSRGGIRDMGRQILLEVTWRGLP